MTRERGSVPMPDASSAWDSEYEAQGIPSSWKTSPSTVVLWALDNLRFASTDARSATPSALDLGCGTGRNSFALAQRGYNVVGLDYSKIAIENALALARSAPELPLQFVQYDVRESLPADDASVDFVIDTFVYFHILRSDDRSALRREVARVLRPGGVLLTSLATAEDGYYATCPEVPDWRDFSDRTIVLDEHAGVGNVLLSEAEATSEWADVGDLLMFWRKRATGDMHGRQYDRTTVASLWRLGDRTMAARSD
jgi:SAM-dependent methyltransferase